MCGIFGIDADLTRMETTSRLAAGLPVVTTDIPEARRLGAKRKRAGAQLKQQQEARI
jgi:hypothetical protein